MAERPKRLEIVAAGEDEATFVLIDHQTDETYQLYEIEDGFPAWIKIHRFDNLVLAREAQIAVLGDDEWDDDDDEFDSSDEDDDEEEADSEEGEDEPEDAIEPDGDEPATTADVADEEGPKANGKSLN